VKRAADTLLLEPFSGISGDMLLGTLVGLGVPIGLFEEQVALLGLADRVTLRTEEVQRAGLAATKVDVVVDGEVEGPGGHHHPTGGERAHGHDGAHGIPAVDLLERLQRPGIDPAVRAEATDVFSRLIDAEARVHGQDRERVHLHEVGGLDATVDVVCGVAGIGALEVERVVALPPCDGTGETVSDHGTIPVPAPATVILLEGRRVRRIDLPLELVTPTGAALLAVLTEEAPPAWTFQTSRTALGAGSRDVHDRPNVLRGSLGLYEVDDPGTDRVVLLETAVDDVSGEVWPFVIERLLGAGALDAWVAPLVMKKGRPGVALTVVAPPDRPGDLERIVFEETGTLGIRVTPTSRRVLLRRSGVVETELGPLRVKLSSEPDGEWRVHPEYEVCREAAREHGRPILEVYDIVRRAAERAGAVRAEETDD